MVRLDFHEWNWLDEELDDILVQLHHREEARAPEGSVA